ncbi:hypothetical protein U1Q18_020190 [Sarracenia purpurea var. burkii]
MEENHRGLESIQAVDHWCGEFLWQRRGIAEVLFSEANVWVLLGDSGGNQGFQCRPKGVFPVRLVVGEEVSGSGDFICVEFFGRSGFAGLTKEDV